VTAQGRDHEFVGEVAVAQADFTGNGGFPVVCRQLKSAPLRSAMADLETVSTHDSQGGEPQEPAKWWAH